ncbi:reverse transcriptase [Gossypium australe]|uniref:Reverse transcriptase n=1 Tax=Gossypium australe TaxID=47621 RepID=A0A5B6VYT4_9ROSI|nr:reverse transcriptase [Gossypium australe]
MGWGDIDVDGSKGGLSLGWNGNSLISLKSYSPFHIDADVNDCDNGVKWRLTGFYGNPIERLRSMSWDLLRHLHNSNCGHWLVLGDFNEITSSCEKREGRLRSENQMTKFRNALEDCGLINLGFSGRWYTWERGRFQETNICERLDRGLLMQAWSGFNNNAVDKLAKAGQFFRLWSRTRSREQKRQRERIEAHLSYLYEQDPTDKNLEKIMEVQLDLNLEADKEEIFWEQRARVNWLKHGDKNTSFFHRLAISRHKRNQIVGIEDKEGRWVTQADEMLNVAVSYFGKLFTASNSTGVYRLLDLVEKRITTDMNDELLRPFSEEEIWQVVKSTAPIKAPGIDGFLALFFQKYWDIVGSDISQYCLAVLKGEIEMDEINKTHIVLIPKVDRPKKLSQFWPISLCNVIYKIIAKVVVNRMSHILGHCIDEAQGAFIAGRQISDNTLIAYEILHSLKSRKKCKRGNFALKLDMSISESFTPSRGLRQGDPFSPFLFLICAEGLSILLNEAKKKRLMIGAPIGRERFSINHLLFADDCILFGDASENGAYTIRSILEEYENASGQQVNFEKSLIYFGASVDQQVRDQITNILGVRVATNPEKYLGLPMMVGRRKRWAFANFIDRFHKRIDSWNFRFLSMGGKEVFVKAILQAIPICVMQCFKLPKSLCSALENIMNKYWWANGKTGKGIHWCSWKDLCYPKIAGGMGYRDLSFFNKALLTKQAWRLFAQPDCLLAKVLKARYFPFTNFLSARIGSYPSFTWRSICGARELIADGLLWRIGNGRKVNIWNDPWLPGPGNNRLLVQNMSIQWTTVNQLIDESSFTWKDDVIRKLVDLDQARRILSIPLARPDVEDVLVWRYDNTGIYTVKSGYRVLIASRPQLTSNNMEDDGKYKNFYKQLWELQIPSKIKIHLWRLIRNYVPHLCNLKKRRLTLEVVCPLCKAAPEDSDHLLWSCERYVHELKTSCMPVYTPFSTKVVFWRPPPVDIIKLKFDASFDRVSKSAITAVVARNDKGLVMGACAYQYTEVVDAFVAKARACERAVLFAIDMGFRKIILEGDSLTVIKKLRSAKNDRPVIHSIKRIFA